MGLTPFLPPVDSPGLGTSAVLKPAGAYDEPQVTQYLLAPFTPQLITDRDFQRALVLVTVDNVLISASVCIDSLCQKPLFILDSTNRELLIRYVDYLTLATCELYIMSPNAATVTVMTVREH